MQESPKKRARPAAAKQESGSDNDDDDDEDEEDSEDSEDSDASDESFDPKSKKLAKPQVAKGKAQPVKRRKAGSDDDDDY